MVLNYSRKLHDNSNWIYAKVFSDIIVYVTDFQMRVEWLKFLLTVVEYIPTNPYCYFF